MSIRVLSSVTGAQSSDPVNVNPPAATALVDRGRAKTLEAVAVGTFTNNVLIIETQNDPALDSGEWVAAATGAASAKSAQVSKTGAAYARVRTTGTAGPYSVDLIVSPNY